MRISWGYWNDFCDRLPIGEINREIDANFGIGTLGHKLIIAHPDSY